MKNITPDTTNRRLTPKAVWVIITLIALLEPLLHTWIALAPPEGVQPTGLHTLDTYAYVGALLHYNDNYYSPYTPCSAPTGDHHPDFYALPHHHLYGLLGYPARWLHLPPFIFLGLVHGAGIAFMLFTFWKLLRRAVPPLARDAFMTNADAKVLNHLDKGVVLAPSLNHPLFGDILVQRPGIKTVYGNGTMDFTHQLMHEVKTKVANFYRPGTDNTFRKGLVSDWCVDYVFCPDTAPINPKVLAEFERTPWLCKMIQKDNAVFFKVAP